MDELTKNQAVQKMIETIKSINPKISYSQAVAILESTIERLKSFQLFKS